MTEAQSLIVAKIWTELAAAVVKKDHAWRTPALATSTLNDRPTLRTVVLRDVDAEKWQCYFYTDKRSPKCQQILAKPQGELLFWCPILKWQLRAEVDYQLLTSGPVIDKTWSQLSATPAADDYLSLQPPGSQLHETTAGTANAPNFAVIIATISQIDWLALSDNGHQRALLNADSIQWLVP
ncbi:MAG: pyridoxamine 5'-phosphate oxidase family protein [Methylophaga sp.]|nr:pyridoxamine 5'-phosphate oxidase family protein [Methylophaga sp.]